MTASSLTGLVLGAGWGAVVALVAATHLRRRGQRRPGHPDDQPSRRGATTADTPARRGVRRDDRQRHAVARRGTGRSTSLRSVDALGAVIRRSLAASRAPEPERPLDAGVTAGIGGATSPTGTTTGHHRSSIATDTPSASATGAAQAAAADRRTGWAAIASVGLLFVAPAVAVVPVAWTVAAPMLAARRDRARHEASLHDQLPDVVDLLALTTAAGLPVAAALIAVHDRPGGPLGAGLARAAAHVRHGGSTSDALRRLAEVGPAVRPLVDALVQHDRYGTPLLPALERVGIESRARRRRRYEEAARRLPVTLLFPLVLTTFPAFVLLTVVPLLAGSLGSLSLTPT